MFTKIKYLYFVISLVMEREWTPIIFFEILPKIHNYTHTHTYSLKLFYLFILIEAIALQYCGGFCHTLT